MPRRSTTNHRPKSSSYSTYQPTGPRSTQPTGPTGTTASSTRASNRKRKPKEAVPRATNRPKRTSIEAELEEVNCRLRSLELRQKLNKALALHEIRHLQGQDQGEGLNLDSSTAQSRIYHRELTRERQLNQELEQARRPKRKRKRNRGQKRKRVPPEQREARRAYLEWTERVHHCRSPDEIWKSEADFLEEEQGFSDFNCGIPSTQIPGRGTKDKRKRRENQRIRV